MSSLLTGVGKELFSYNRDSYIFDKKIAQEREYQEQEMRLAQFDLYRDDIHDLMELTTGKMDAYLPPVLLMLGCCSLLLVHGMMTGDAKEVVEVFVAPWWLVALYAWTLSQAFLFLFSAGWFAIHASITAHSFGVRLLTQFVRLPVPGGHRIEAARAYGVEFENMGEMFRVPLAGHVDNVRQMVGGESDTAQQVEVPMSEDQPTPVVSLKHISLWRELQANWQAHDAYARASLTLAAYALDHAFAYFLVELFVYETRAPCAGFAAAVVLGLVAWLITKLELYFSSYVYVVMAMIVMLGPLLAFIASIWEESRAVLVPCIFFLNVLLILGVSSAVRSEQTSGNNVDLPSRFRTVLYLDVFGWLGDPSGPTVQQQGPKKWWGASGVTLPRQLLDSLREECHQKIEGIKRELVCWESPGNAEAVEGRPEIGKEMLRLRKLLDRQMRDLLEVEKRATTAGVELQHHQVALPKDQQIWLKFSWQNADPDHEYYHCPQLGKTVLEKDLPPNAFISELDVLKDRINQLDTRLDPLKKHRTWTPDQPASGQTAVAPIDQGVLGVHVDAEHPFQAQRFGGDEAADLNAVNNRFDAHAAAAETFHPRRDGRIESRRPLGTTPWAIFWVVTKVLIAVWLSGVGFGIYVAIFDPKLNKDVDVEAEAEVESPEESISAANLTGLKIDLNASWPNLFNSLTPTGLACHSSFGSTLLVTERFAVHKILLNVGNVSLVERSESVHRCLSQVPEFHTTGLAGANLDCSNEKSCNAILLSGDGNQALICPIMEAGSNSPKLVRLMKNGKGWQSLAASQSSSSDWWGLPREKAQPQLMSVQLNKKTGARAALKVNQVSQNVTGRSRALSTHGNIVVGLSEGGTLVRAWTTREGIASAGEWRLPQQVRWDSLCATKTGIFAVGGSGKKTTSMAKFELWKFDWPSELRSI